MKKLYFGVSLLLCMLFSFSAQAQLAGSTFSNPLIVSSLPYVVTGDSTCGYGDNYTTSDIACSGSYMSGDEKIYAFTPTSNIASFNVELTNLATTWSGMYITDDSTTNGSCLGNVGSSGTNDRGIYNVGLTAGTTYYIIVSTFASPQCISSFDINMYTVTCPAPTALNVTGVLHNAATLTWTEIGSAATWQVEYDTAGFAQGAGNMVVNTTGSESISGLTESTVYEFYVRSICGAGDSSLWAGPYSFTTACLPELAPYVESFDSGIPSCWSQTAITGGPWTTSGTPGYGAAGVQDHTGNGGDFVWMDFSSTDVGVSLVSKLIDVSALTTPYLDFYFYTNNTDDGSINDLIVEAFDGATWVELDSIHVNSGGWAQFGYDISSYTFGGTLSQVRFRAESGGSTTDHFQDFVLDDISIIEMPACVSLSGLNVTNLTATGGDISWVDPNGAASWQMEFDTAGFSLGTGNSSIISNNPHTLNSLSAFTSYDVYVRAICAPGDSSSWIGPLTFTTLCNAEIAPYTESFDNGIPGCWSQTAVTGGPWVTTGAPGYGATNVQDHTNNGGDFVWMDFSVPDEAVSLITNNIDVSALTTPWLEFYYYNNNTNDSAVNSLYIEGFNGTSWTIIDSIKQNLGDWTYFGYDISGFTFSGNLVQIRFRAEPDTVGSVYYHDLVLDDISVLEMPTCFDVSGLSASNVTINSAELSWVDPNGASSWSVQFDTAGFALGTGIDSITTQNPFTLNGLSPNTSYEYYVRAICGPGDTANWTGPFIFTTECGVVNSFPFVETFEANSPSRNCWENDYEVGTADWTYNSGASGGAISSAYSGNTNARFVSQSGTNSPITRLVSPVFDLSTLANPEITFSYAQESWFSDQNYTRLLYRSASTSPWIELWSDSSNVAVWTTVSVALPNASSTYQIAFEGINNYGRTNVVDEVMVNEALNINLNMTPAVCSYDTNGTAQVTASGGLAPYYYDWSTGDSVASIADLSAGWYTVTVTDSLGATGIDSILVTANAPVVVDLGNDTALCFGDSISLSAGPGFNAYLWSTGSTDSLITTSGMIGATTYAVGVQDIDGCVGGDSVVITVNAPVNADLGADTTVCFGSQLTLTPGTYSSYAWSTGETTASITLNLTMSGTVNYGVTVTDANGCNGVDDINVATAQPVLPMLGNDTTVCFGESVTITPGTYQSYAWSTGETTSSIMVSPVGGTSDTVSVEVMDSNMCTGMDTIVITVLEELMVDLGNDTTICEGDTLVLNPGTFDSYIWADGSTSPTLDVFCANGAGTWYVEVEKDGCIAFDTIEVTCSYITFDLGADTTITDTNATVVLDAGSQYSSYLWNDNSNQQTLVVAIANSGQIWCEVTNSDGCVASDTINVDFVTGIDEVAIGSIKLYPNPAVNNLVVELGQLQGSGEVNIALLTVSGQTVYQSQIENGSSQLTHNINVSSLASGMYFVEIGYQGHKEIRTIVIQ